MRIPIRFQLMGPLVAVAVVSLAAVALLHARFVTEQTRQRIEQQVSGVADVLGQSSFPLTDKVLQQMAGLADAELVLTDAGGKRIATSGAAAEGALEAIQRRSDGPLPNGVSLSETMQTAAGAYFYSSLPVRRSGELLRAQKLHVLVSKADYNAAWRAAFVPPMLVAAAAAAAVVFVTHLATGRISRLMGRIGREVSRLADGDFRPVVVPQLDDESRDLAEAVNRAAERLAEYEEEVRTTERLKTLATLGAGMAHEVRNAVTGCRMAIDLHDDECDAAAAGGETLEVARRQLGLIERRLKQYLAVGKPAPVDAVEAVDLAQVARDAVGLTSAAARHAGVVVEAAVGPAPLLVSGSAENLTHAIVNLLLNATEAAAKRQALEGTPATVRIELHADDEGATLEVIDSGSGPDADVAPHAFEPFTTNKPEGVGLGLAIVRSAAEQGGGSASWRRDGDQTCFTVRMPLANKELAHV